MSMRSALLEAVGMPEGPPTFREAAAEYARAVYLDDSLDDDGRRERLYAVSELIDDFAVDDDDGGDLVDDDDGEAVDVRESFDLQEDWSDGPTRGEQTREWLKGLA